MSPQGSQEPHSARETKTRRHGRSRSVRVAVFDKTACPRRGPVNPSRPRPSGLEVVCAGIIEVMEYLNPDPAASPVPTYSPAQPPVQPAEPALNVLSKPIEFGPLLVKPTSAFEQVRNQLRQGQASLRSRDTTQSQFFCPYEDCQHVGHADETAAINIVWKWWTEGDVRSSETVGSR